MRDGVLVEENWVLAVIKFLILVLFVLLTGTVFIDDGLVFQINVEHNQIFVLLKDICVSIARLENAESFFEFVFEWVTVVFETNLASAFSDFILVEVCGSIVVLLTITIFNKESIDIQLMVEKADQLVVYSTITRHRLLHTSSQKVLGLWLLLSQLLPVLTEFFE